MRVMSLVNSTSFGLKDGKIIHISEIDSKSNGLSCGCVCPKCEQPLEAHLGDVYVHHFKHYNKDSCTGSMETGLHMLAKEIFRSGIQVNLPKLIAEYYINDDSECCFDDNFNYGNWRETKVSVFKKERSFIYSCCELEHKIGDIIPDIVLFKDNEPLIIEIKVTHGINAEKLSKLKEARIPVVEIDLSNKFNDYNDFDRDKLREFIINDPNSKTWVYHPDFEEHKKQLKTKVEKKLDKIHRIKYLTSYKHQEYIKDLWDKELDNNPAWIYESNLLGINRDTIPDYLNTEIDGEIVFNCDRRIWQCKIFNIFINNWKESDNPYETISIKYLVNWVKNYRKLETNWPLHYTKDIEDELPNIPSLTDVLFDFMMNLAKFGFVKPSDKSMRINGDKYYWTFDKLNKIFQ